MNTASNSTTTPCGQCGDNQCPSNISTGGATCAPKEYDCNRTTPYSPSDGVVSIKVGNKLYYAAALKETTDDPIGGALKTPPSWFAKPCDEWLSYYVDPTGKPLPNGDCVITCDDVDPDQFSFVTKLVNGVAKTYLQIKAGASAAVAIGKGLIRDATTGAIITNNKFPLSHDDAGKNILLFDDETLTLNKDNELTVKPAIVDFASHYMKNDDNGAKVNWKVGDRIHLNAQHGSSPASVIGNADIVDGYGVFKVAGGYNMTITSSTRSITSGNAAIIGVYRKKPGQTDAEGTLLATLSFRDSIADYDYNEVKLRQPNFEEGDLVYGMIKEFIPPESASSFRLRYLHINDYIPRPNVKAISKALN